jgi:hypothetical protein
MLWENGDERAKQRSNIISGAISSMAKGRSTSTTFGHFARLRHACARLRNR